MLFGCACGFWRASQRKPRRATIGSLSRRVYAATLAKIHRHTLLFRRTAARPQELQVIQDFYDLSLGLSGRILKFPRHVRYGLGLAIERRLQDVLALLIRAKYAPAVEKPPILKAANVELEVLRFQVRQAGDL
ncbi:MAG: four helix bundle protein [Gemmataceae bacterium]